MIRKTYFSPMHNWIEKIDETSQKIEKSFQKLSKDELNWRPSSRSWSIAQVIEHLTRVNESYFPVFEKLLSGKYQLPFIARLGFLVSFFGNAIRKSVEPANPKKMKTFGSWEPSPADFSEQCLEEFLNSQEKLKDYIESSKEFISKKQVIYSPVNKNIVYRLETAFDIIVLHQERHYLQALRILEEQRHSGQDSV